MQNILELYLLLFAVSLHHKVQVKVHLYLLGFQFIWRYMKHTAENIFVILGSNRSLNPVLDLPEKMK
jgi:hypothetical protein